MSYSFWTLQYIIPAHGTTNRWYLNARYYIFINDLATRTRKSAKVIEAFTDLDNWYILIQLRAPRHPSRRSHNLPCSRSTYNVNSITTWDFFFHITASSICYNLCIYAPRVKQVTKQRFKVTLRDECVALREKKIDQRIRIDSSKYCLDFDRYKYVA